MSRFATADDPQPDGPYPGRQVWFLTGSQDLYGERVLQQVADQSREVVAQLAATPEVPVHIVWKPVLRDAESIRRAVLEANGDDSVIGVMAWMHTFSPARMWIAGLAALQVPLQHQHTHAKVTFPWDTNDLDLNKHKHAAHGDREFGYMAARMSVPRSIVAGHASDPAVGARVGTWMRAAAAWADVRSMRLARFGDNMRQVAVTEGDKTEAGIRLGVSVNTWGVNDLADTVAEVGDREVTDLVVEYQDRYDVAPELRGGGDRHESLRYGARQEIALRTLLDRLGATAFTTTFEDLGALRQLPGLAVQRLMADGYGFGAEGDWKTAICVRAAKVMGAGLPGGASLMEDYTYDLTPGDERILGAHMLEVCPSLSAGRAALQIHPLGIGGREDPVRLVFSADPGPGVLVSLTDMGDRFRLTANAVDVVPPSAPLPKLPVGHAVWRPRPDFRTSAEAWLTAGGSHHTALSTAVGVDTWECFAQMTGMELLVIDETTTVRAFRDAMRWNQAHYRLAQGF
jgi:L-arabinose isomerase